MGRLQLVWLLLAVAVGQDVLPIPSVLFGQLFSDVQTQQVYDDQKTFCDALFLEAPATIMELFHNNTMPLSTFVSRYFVPSASPPINPPPNQTMPKRIEWLWPYLTRRTVVSNSSLIALPKSYVVPGSRFSESFYWDSYFIARGMSDQNVKESMIDNFADMIDRFGFVPNGNRNYFLSRSQPPFFSLMVQEISLRPVQSFVQQLTKEYAYWMSGNHVVKMPDGALLNRYWDALDIPRDESYLEDVTACSQCRGGVNCASLYRDLRSAAESGWDFSSRWLGNKSEAGTLCSVRTTQILPVDLNALLYSLEVSLGEACSDEVCKKRFAEAASSRVAAVEKWMWCQEGFYCDFDLGLNRTVSESPTAAMMFPLFVKLANASRAEQTAKALQQFLLEQGGVVTTTHDTGQQWDFPMGWAPLQWVAVQGLANYNHGTLAEEIGRRFIAVVAAVFAKDGKLVEKYNVVNENAGGGGEYPLEDGFGWTNGVTMALMTRYPALVQQFAVRARSV